MYFSFKHLLIVFYKHRSLINLLAGLIIGFLLCCQFRAIKYQLKTSGLCRLKFHHNEDERPVKDADDYRAVLDSIKWMREDKPEDGRRKLIFVGVMSAQKYLNTRALSINRTWARQIPGNLLFFTSFSSKSEYNLPIMALPTVDDSYPPQKKSFLMLKFMHDHFIDDYEWFIRADDDVYMDMERLSTFLLSLNSSKPHFIGQPGVGNKEEFGQLNLEPTENFCMGGPGIIFSRASLKLLAPNIQYCLKHLYSTHEDVEVGRCVKKFVGITCTWAYEMNSVFYHNFSGEISLDDPLRTKALFDAMTFHPLKSPSSMYQMHKHILQRRHEEMRNSLQEVHREIDEVEARTQIKTNSMSRDPSQRSSDFLHKGSLTVRPHQSKCISKHDIITWNFIDRYFYSASDVNPKRKMDGYLKEAIDANIVSIVSSINKQAKERGRYIEFKSLYYAYSKMDPLRGAQYILDLLLSYRKQRGRKYTVPVRRHAYVVQNFGAPQIRRLPVNIHQPINIIVPLSGRLKAFERFVAEFAKLRFQDPFVTLVVVLFPDAFANNEELVHIKTKVNNLISDGYQIRMAQLGGHFARAAGLERGASLFEGKDLLFFVDIDMHLNLDVLMNVRLNTVRGKQVYYPIVYSQYNPQYTRMSESLNTTLGLIAGYWRQYGFGIVSVYKDDLQSLGGFNVAIQGWGKEDVDLFTKSVKSNLDVFRAPDPNLVHIHHDIKCDPALVSAQYDMCVGTKLSSLASTIDLVQYVQSNKIVS